MAMPPLLNLCVKMRLDLKQGPSLFGLETIGLATQKIGSRSCTEVSKADQIYESLFDPDSGYLSEEGSTGVGTVTEEASELLCLSNVTILRYLLCNHKSTSNDHGAYR